MPDTFHGLLSSPGKIGADYIKTAWAVLHTSVGREVTSLESLPRQVATARARSWAMHANMTHTDARRSPGQPSDLGFPGQEHRSDCSVLAAKAERTGASEVAAAAPARDPAVDQKSVR